MIRNELDYKTLARWLAVVLLAILSYFGHSYDVRLRNVENDIAAIKAVVCPIAGDGKTSKPLNLAGFLTSKE